MKRRDFIKTTSLASGMLLVPSFVKAFDSTYLKSQGYKRLVIIQLSGGNDGLNTIIPYRNDIYYNARPRLAISDGIIKVSDELGFHPSLKALQPLYEEGELSIINNVGYPNPVRSHFKSMDIWHTAGDANSRLRSGWLGRYLDLAAKHPYDAIETNEFLSLALKGERFSGVATEDYKILYNTSRDPYFNRVLTNSHSQHLGEHNLGYLYQTMIEAKSSAKYIYENTKTSSSTIEYPKNELGRQLNTSARFINSHLDTKVYYHSLSGFDTHANQANPQKRLLKIYAESVAAFVKDLKKGGTFEDTLILTFSEFGRRVKQNAANGTDHGTAINVFVIGKKLRKAGFYNDLASLEDLDRTGDIKYSIDFREVYKTILNRWLNIDDPSIIPGNFQTLSFI
ncbi:MAG: DUF1501 domain-containing protein [Bacteroidota bacterium]